MKMIGSLALSVCALLVAKASGYGFDCSFPIQNVTLSTDCGDMPDRSEVYKNYMQGCRAHYSGSDCDEHEEMRLRTNRLQPISMVNYTSGGFRKVRAPPDLQKLLSEFWETNKGKAVDEEWDSGNIFTNHWEVPTKFVDVSDDELVGGGESLMEAIWTVAKKEVEEWTGIKVRPSSLYGIRIYTEGSILNSHVDRLPLISSCIVNVAQDVDEDWPLEVYTRFGDAMNITMKPFDMVFYESHSLIHGRPFPLHGRYFANIFIHFEAVGERLDGTVEQIDPESILPPYVLPNSPWAEIYLEEHPTGWSKALSEKDYDWITSLAAEGDIKRLKKFLDLEARLVNVRDDEGWQPLHYAVEGDQLEMVKFLIERGADVNAETIEEEWSPIFIAKVALGASHPITDLLLKAGAKDIDVNPDDYDDDDEEEDEDDDDELDEGEENEL